MKYTLMDCEEQNAKHPDTFQIDDSSNVQVGDWAKLVFQGEDHFDERMWVKVITVIGDTFMGVLDNEPVLFEKEDLALGHVVVFERRHIANVTKPEPAHVRVPRYH